MKAEGGRMKEEINNTLLFTPKISFKNIHPSSFRFFFAFSSPSFQKS